jgi:hypothetical protein
MADSAAFSSSPSTILARRMMGLLKKISAVAKMIRDEEMKGGKQQQDFKVNFFASYKNGRRTFSFANTNIDEMAQLQREVVQKMPREKSHLDVFVTPSVAESSELDLEGAKKPKVKAVYAEIDKKVEDIRRVMLGEEEAQPAAAAAAAPLATLGNEKAAAAAAKSPQQSRKRKNAVVEPSAAAAAQRRKPGRPRKTPIVAMPTLLPSGNKSGTTISTHGGADRQLQGLVEHLRNEGVSFDDMPSASSTLDDDAETSRDSLIREIDELLESIVDVMPSKRQRLEGASSSLDGFNTLASETILELLQSSQAKYQTEDGFALPSH